MVFERATGYEEIRGEETGVTAGRMRLEIKERATAYLRAGGGRGRRGSDLPALTTGIRDAAVLSRTGWGLQRRGERKHNPVT